MGLDTTHDCWHGPYSSFHRWRVAIAKAAGLPPLDSMEGFGGRTAWGLLPPSALHVLLSHSDCDGEIAAADCAPLADALEALLPRIVDAEAWEGPHSLRAKTERFITGLRSAAAAGEAVEFH